MTNQDFKSRQVKLEKLKLRPLDISPLMNGQLDTVGKRIQWLRLNGADRPMTFQEIGDICDVSAQAVEQWEKIPDRLPKSARIRLLAAFFNVDPAWITHGSGKPDTASIKQIKAVASDGTIALAFLDMRRTRFNTVKIAMSKAVAEKELRNTHAINRLGISNKSYFANVIDRSMEPDYKVGDELLIDPKASPEPGDDVYIDSQEWGQPALRRFKLAAGNIYLFEALNPNYDSFQCAKADFGKIIKLMGVMMEHRRYRRQ